VLHHFALEFLGALAQPFPARDFGDRFQAVGVKAEGRRAIGFLKMRIGESLVTELVNFVTVNACVRHIRESRSRMLLECGSLLPLSLRPACWPGTGARYLDA